eukprot:jgi/Picsp_1/6027/NSC_03381-R1_aldo keto reductase
MDCTKDGMVSKSSLRMSVLGSWNGVCIWACFVGTKDSNINLRCLKVAMLSRLRKVKVNYGLPTGKEASSYHFHPTKGQHLPMSTLCLGTMMFGDSINEIEAHRQLDMALENGINVFDTAEMYPVPQQEHTQGASERCLGQWMQGKDRLCIIISSKVAGPGSMSWLRDGPSRLNGSNIRMAVEGSLSRLKTDYIDILHLHWPDRYVPMFGDAEFDCNNVYAFSSFEDQLEEVGKLYHEGKIRCFGLSNETPYGIMKYCSLADQESKFPKPIYLQNSFSLLCRTFLSSGVAECCYLEDIKLMAYSPLAMGLLSGKYLDMDSLDPNSRLIKFKGRYAEAESRYGPKPNVRKAIEAYVSLAQTFGMDPVELAIRFALSQPQVCTLVVGASSTYQLRLLIDYAAKGSLDAHVLSEIDAIHQRYPNPAP